MKKLLKFSILALMAIPAMIGCNNNNNKGQSGVEEAAKQAISEVGAAYNGFSQSGGLTLAGAKLITEHKVGDYEFKFTYSVAPMGNPYSIEYLKIDTEKMRLVVEIPTFAELESQGFPGATYAGYKLNAKVLNADKEVGEGSWNVRINAEEVKPVWEKISAVREKTSGTVVTTGYITAFMNPVDEAEYGNGIWIADGADGTMLYSTSKLAAYFGSLKIGDMVMVIGTASPYNGLFEIKDPIVTLVDDSPEAIAEPVWTSIGESELGSYTATKANDPVTISGATITSDLSGKEATSGSALSIDVKVGGKTITLYENKHTNTAHRQAVIDLVNANVGKTVTIKSVLGWNSGKLQITGCVIVEGGTLASSLTFAA